MPSLPSSRRFTRDSVLFAFGILGIIYETVIEHIDRPTLLIVFGACLGLPAFLHTDEARAVAAKAAELAAKPPLPPETSSNGVEETEVAP